MVLQKFSSGGYSDPYGGAFLPFLLAKTGLTISVTV